MKYTALVFSLIASAVYGQEFYTDFDNLKPGTKGYALTVFKGTEPERMELEVVDYIPTRFTAQGMVIIKLNGENVERSRVAAGMSGSPVFIGDKLLGALAYTWANSRELIAGVTLIQDMIKDGERGASLPLPNMQAIEGSWVTAGIDDPELLQRVKTASRSARTGLEPTILAPSTVSNGISPFKGGDAVAVKLIEGDITLASIGTVTHVDGDKVYIYGHPMDQWGTLTLPLSKAKIYTILSSTDISFKMGSATETVGATVFDGGAAVFGRTDRAAPMTPVKLSFDRPGDTKTYNFAIARSPKYLPALAGSAVGALLTKELGKNIEYNVFMDWAIRFTNGETVSNSALWTKGSEYDPASLRDFWDQYISVLWDNQVSALVPEEIRLNVRLEDQPHARYQFQELRADRYDFLPGESLSLRMGLMRPQDGVLTTNITLTLPANIKQGRYTIYAGSAASIDAEVFAAYPEAKVLRSESAILQELRRPVNTKELKAVLVEPEAGSVSATGFLKNLPSSKRSLFKSRGLLGKPLTYPKLTSSSLLLDRPLSGLGSVTINVQELKTINPDQQKTPPTPAARASTNTNS